MVKDMFSGFQGFKATPVLFLALCVFVLGCGSDPNRAGVKGKVTLDSQPVEKGTISFSPADSKGPSTGAVITKGTYVIPTKVGAAVGKNNVVIRATRATGKKVRNPYGDNEVEETVEIIPHKYNLKSTLVADISKGKSNVADFNLESDKKKK